MKFDWIRSIIMGVGFVLLLRWIIGVLNKMLGDIFSEFQKVNEKLDKLGDGIESIGKDIDKLKK